MSDEPISPPHDDAVEESLLGTILLFPDEAGPIVLPSLKAEDWYQECHQAVARFLMQSIEDGRTADAVTLAHYIRETGIPLDSSFVPKIMDAAPSGANIGAQVEIIRELSLKRRLIATGSVLEEEGRNGRRAVEVLAAHRVRVEDLERETVGRNALRSWTAPDLLKAEIPEPISLVGDHLLDQGGLSVISGKGGLGKSNLMLALSVDITLGGREWLRVPLPEEKCRTLYLWGEGGDYFAKKRLQLLEEEAEKADGCLMVVPREITPDLRESSAIAELKQLLTAHKPHLVVIDHISEWSGGMDDSDNAQMKVFLRVLGGLRRFSGAHFSVIAHNRKPGENSKRGDQSEVRGASALTSAADTVIMLDAEPGDRIRVTWSKVKNTGRPEPLICKYQPETGRYLIETTGVSDARTVADRIKEALFNAGERLTLKQILTDVGVSERTGRRYMDKLVSSGEVTEDPGIGVPNLYSLPDKPFTAP